METASNPGDESQPPPTALPRQGGLGRGFFTGLGVAFLFFLGGCILGAVLGSMLGVIPGLALCGVGLLGSWAWLVRKYRNLDPGGYRRGLVAGTAVFSALIVLNPLVLCFGVLVLSTIR